MQSQDPLSHDQPTDRQELENIWNGVAKDLKAELGLATFDLWFSDFTISSTEEEVVTFRAPGSMYAIWVEENFKNILLSILPNY